MPDGSSSSATADRAATPVFGLVSRIAAFWKLKALLAVAIATLFCIPYFLLGNFPMMPVHELPSTWLDRKIGFHPYAWVWAYQSLYPLLNIVPWLANQRGDLARYARGFALMSAISFTIFALFPTRVPRPFIDHAAGMYRLLRWYDTPLNAFPSLHAAMCVYTLAFGWRIFRGVIPFWLCAVFVLWGALILYGTMATKEHYVIDVIAGALIALASHKFVWRRE